MKTIVIFHSNAGFEGHKQSDKQQQRVKEKGDKRDSAEFRVCRREEVVQQQKNANSAGRKKKSKFRVKSQNTTAMFLNSLSFSLSL